jgi:propionyl-CoA synthetase
LLGLVVLKQTAIDENQDKISRELIAMVRAQIGPVAAFKHALCVQMLPKVKSGKILRKTMKAIFDNQEYAFPGNIEDPTVLTYIEEVAADFAKSQA